MEEPTLEIFYEGSHFHIYIFSARVKEETMESGNRIMVPVTQITTYNTPCFCVYMGTILVVQTPVLNSVRSQ